MLDEHKEIESGISLERAMGYQPPRRNLLSAAESRDTSMRPKTTKKRSATSMWRFQMTRMPSVMMIVVMNMTNVTATPATTTIPHHRNINNIKMRVRNLALQSKIQC